MTDRQASQNIKRDNVDIQDIVADNMCVLHVVVVVCAHVCPCVLSKTSDLTCEKTGPFTYIIIGHRPQLPIRLTQMMPA
jgi:hypothetical protein